NIITEWHTTTPAANVFEGSRRELLREAHVVANLTHPMGAVEFNPVAKPGDPDYGLLYTSGSDHGFSNGGGPNANTASQTQRLDSIMTAILRLDPRSPKVTGDVKGLGDYTIPMANKFASDGDPKTLGEIYAYGFRNAHRLSWDTRSEEHTSELQSHSDLHSFPTRRSSDLTIPMANKFASDGDPKTLGEIYAYGFRNAHRLSWDTDGDIVVSRNGIE